ncbi:unnamed protein product [Cuscuta epithymum]|uniref:Ubiquitin-like domain-containing protein n=1 Tax=Cuscuta epithymum TaxID=186058 RepID=A0AAV0DJM5_9ASTE|nr:unnamed protein product [Cuscuta epithymum]CAH9133263.1 unnamed protein product [Cuscuta epithymum]
MSTRPNPNPQRNGEEDEEMDVSLRIIKTVSFKVNKRMTVGGVKALLSKKERIPECMQELFYNGNHLENDTKMVDYSISTNSTLNAYVSDAAPLNLTIKIPQRHDTVLVQARSENTVQNIKALIEARENIPSCSHSLVHAGKLLEEDKTLAFLEIREGSTLHVVFIPQGMFLILVKLLDGEVLDVEVNMGYTILDVKVLLESIVGYPVGDLTCEGEILVDSWTLSHHSISIHSMLEMAPPPPPPPPIEEVRQMTQIFIKWRGKSTPIEVCLGDSVKRLKEIIGSEMVKSGATKQLELEGKRLPNGKDLASCGVQKGSTLDLFLIIY